jgi:hypothetical protein
MNREHFKCDVGRMTSLFCVWNMVLLNDTLFDPCVAWIAWLTMLFTMILGDHLFVFWEWPTSWVLRKFVPFVLFSQALCWDSFSRDLPCACVMDLWSLCFLATSHPTI